MTAADIKNLSNQFLSVNRIDSPDNQAEELFELDVRNFGKIYACIKDVTFGGRANLQDESRIQIHCTCNNYIYNQLQSSKDAIIIGVGKYEDTQIYCAFKPEFSNGSSTISKQIKKDTIEKAAKYGFAQQLKGNVFACVFQSPFLPFYLNNYKWIHDAPLEELNNQNKNPVLPGKIPFSHNRIVFGAPGTGKSHKLQEDVEKYFSSTINYESLLKEEIKNRPQEADKEPWFNHIGIKYANYVYKLSHEKTEAELQELWGITQNELWKMKTAARACIDYNHSINNSCNDIPDTYERVTFHPNYSYAQFVGTYKPITKQVTNLSEEQKEILSTLLDKSKTAQEKYDLLYNVFKGESLTRLPILIGLYDDGLFHTKKTDGTPSANDNMVERNHGKAIRPYVNIENIAKEEITYEYVPGPFIRTFIKAKKTGQNVLLLIEEINRANVAAVFGDVFQLLDRNSDGTSEYPITTSEDLRKFLAKPENLGGSPNDYKTISIPSNMYIWATMNSADQGVLPMDAAFKRRWEFEYINIDDGAGELNGVTIPIPNGKNPDGSVKYESIEWNELRKAINEQLKKVSGVNEDKLLGPFFIGDETKIKNAAQNAEQFCKSFKSKVLMYLFEDVVKMQPGELFETKDGSNIHYSDICKDFDSIGLKIFVKSIYEKFPEFKDGDAE